MNRLYFLLFAFLLLFIFQISYIKSLFLNIALPLEEEIIGIKNEIKNKIKFCNSGYKELNRLKKENIRLETEIENLKIKCMECERLKYFQELDIPNLKFVKVISYASLPDFTQVYIDYNKQILTPKGLIYNNFAAGIAVKNIKNYSLAYLNQNPKTRYSVLVGKNQIPGIFFGKENVVKYLKKFVKIKKGDIVITSGLDGVFYKGAFVGKVEKVIQTKLYQEAKIKLFYNNFAPDYFYIVEKNGTIKQQNF
ncbi:MAG: rod shape-determining protein MreC [Nautiliaceae bacterium]